MYDRPSQLVCELGGLVEAASPAPSRVKRYRHHAVGVAEDRCAGFTHERAEPDCQRVPSVVFQEVDELSEGALVGTDGA